MPVNPSELLFGQITEDEILEFVHGVNSPRVDNFTNGGCDLELKLKLPGDKLKPAMQWILGVNYVDQSQNLRRHLPMFHSTHCWAYARSISIQGQQFDGDDVAAQVWDFQVMPSKWKQYEATVQFDIPRYLVLEDDEVDQEHERFVSKDTTDRTQIVSIDNGQVVYEANAGDAWDGKPHNSIIPVARRNAVGLNVKWWHVPADFVQPDDDTVPVKLFNAKGTVNDATFMGCAAETLLLEHVELKDKYVSPVMTDQTGKLTFMYDIEFQFLYVNQLAAQVGKAGETRRGHNLLFGPNLKYWYAKNASGDKIFPTLDFNKLFTHYTDTIT